MRPLENIVGNAVAGDRFWGREAELEDFIKLLDRGSHILMVAQRRMGKTSLMKEAARKVERRYICLSLDLQKAKSPAEVIATLAVETRKHDSLWEKTKGIFANAIDSLKDVIDTIQVASLTVTFQEHLGESQWQEKGDRLLEVLANADRPVAIFCDEFPILVGKLLHGPDELKGTEDEKEFQRRGKTEAWMSWLRAGCLKHQGKIRFVVTGSIGLEPLLHQAELSATINHLTPFDIKAWPDDMAYGCWDALALGSGLSFGEGAKERMADSIGSCIPYHVQLFFRQVQLQCDRENRCQISVDLVDRVYEKDMLGRRGHAELNHLEERLGLVLRGKQSEFARELLSEAAIADELTSAAAKKIAQSFSELVYPDALQQVIEVLEHDGYLVRRGKVFQFDSKLLKDWWKAKYEFTFTPSADRGK